MLGESVAVDGACLTVVSFAADHFNAFLSRETLSKTTFERRVPGEVVHLERALRLDQRLGGHLLSGHVDGVGQILARKPKGEAEEFIFSAPPALAPMIAPKGSIAIEGVSLTVNEVEGNRFHVMLVPYTLEHTKFGTLRVGSEVHLEIDLIARYVARWLKAQHRS